MCRSVLVLAALICMKFKVSISMLSSCMIDLVSLCSVLFSSVNAKIVFLLFSLIQQVQKFLMDMRNPNDARNVRSLYRNT